MNKALKIEYQLSESEYLTATRLLFFQSKEIMIRMVVFSVLAFAGAIMMNMILVDMTALLGLIAVVIVFDVFIFYNALVMVPRHYYRGDPKFREKYDLTFSDQGVSVKTFQLDSKLAWSLYTKAIEGKDMYLLIYGKDIRMMTPVPKRAFRNRDDEVEFREMVSRQISDCSGLRTIPPEERNYTPSSMPDWR